MIRHPDILVTVARGAQITVMAPVKVRGGSQTFRTIVGDRGSGEFTWSYDEVDPPTPGAKGPTGVHWSDVCKYSDENITWARGWDTSAADALKAAAALTRDG